MPLNLSPVFLEQFRSKYPDEARGLEEMQAREAGTALPVLPPARSTLEIMPGVGPGTVSLFAFDRDGAPLLQMIINERHVSAGMIDRLERWLAHVDRGAAPSLELIKFPPPDPRLIPDPYLEAGSLSHPRLLRDE